MTTILSEDEVLTRKPHRCDWCPEMIEPKQKATKRAYIFEGYFSYGYLHPECLDALGKSEHMEDGFPMHEQKRGVPCDGYGDPMPETT
jgi:hypothetical protein